MLDKKNKKAQIGKTLTWIAATIIIVFVLAVSIFIANLFPGKDKKIESPYFQITDVLASKSLYSYALTQDSDKKTVYSQIKDEGNLNDFNGNLGLKIFRGLYQKDYFNNPNNIWLGVVVNTGENLAENQEPKFDILESMPNDFFNPRPGGARGTAISYHTIPHTSEKINFNETKYLELVLVGKK